MLVGDDTAVNHEFGAFSFLVGFGECVAKGTPVEGGGFEFFEVDATAFGFVGAEFVEGGCAFTWGKGGFWFSGGW